MSAAEQYSKMAEELYDKARKENNEYSKSEFERAAEIYSLLAQRAQADDGTGAPGMTDKHMPDKLDALIESDAKGLQQQILQHFTTRPTT
jgi:hypothetical protein